MLEVNNVENNGLEVVGVVSGGRVDVDAVEDDTLCRDDVEPTILE